MPEFWIYSGWQKNVPFLEGFFLQPLIPPFRISEPGYLERTSVLDFVGAASSRDQFNSRLKAAPTGIFFNYLSLPHKRISEYIFEKRYN